MALTTAFQPAYGTGLTQAASATPASVASGFGNTSICLTNTGAVTVYVRIGDSSVTATTADYPVLSGTQVILTKNREDTHVAYRTDTLAGELKIISGEGL